MKETKVKMRESPTMGGLAKEDAGIDGERKVRETLLCIVQL